MTFWQEVAVRASSAGPESGGETTESSGSDVGDSPCGVNTTDKLGLRIAAIFIILATSLFGSLFPVLSKRVNYLRKIVPGAVFEFAKFFGSGVILATSLIHLLEPAADDELGPANTIALGGCISNAWAAYPYAFGICLLSLFSTFLMELIAFRVGTAWLAKHGFHDGPGNSDRAQVVGREGQPHAHVLGEQGLEIAQCNDTGGMEKKADSRSDLESGFCDSSENLPASAQVLGVAILEFGVVFHSIIIGLTLALSDKSEFTTLLIVIIFHQMFEGLGLGTRLAFLKLPVQWSWVPFAGAILYSCITPLGMAIGLGTKESTSMTSAAASIASGVLDSTSAGILLYTGTVELMAHEFIFNPYYHKCSWKKLTFVIVSFALGAGIMALLGKWA